MTTERLLGRGSANAFQLQTIFALEKSHYFFILLRARSWCIYVEKGLIPTSEPRLNYRCFVTERTGDYCCFRRTRCLLVCKYCYFKWWWPSRHIETAYRGRSATFSPCSHADRGQACNNCVDDFAAAATTSGSWTVPGSCASAEEIARGTMARGLNSI